MNCDDEFISPQIFVIDPSLIASAGLHPRIAQAVFTITDEYKSLEAVNEGRCPGATFGKKLTGVG